MMPQTETTTYLLLDSHQGHAPSDGWQVQQTQHLHITPEGLHLAPKASPLVPLQDARGTFGGLENPTGVAVDAAGVIYVADISTHRIFKVVHREGWCPQAHFFHIGAGPFAN